MESVNQSELCFPLLANLSCRKSSSSFSGGVFVTFVLPLVSILTVLLNLIVIVSISHFRQLHTPTNLLLLSLAIADAIVGLLMIPAQIYSTASCWLLGDIVCALFTLIMVLVTAASVGNMVLISADRYVAICDPLRYNVKITVKRIQLCVCLCWLSSLIGCCIIFNDQLTHPGKLNSCYGECVVNVDIDGGIIDVILSFILPLSIIITLYSRVFVVALSQARAVRIHAYTRGIIRMGAKKSELKAARTLGVLVLVFLACFCPYYIDSVVNNSKKISQQKIFVLHLFSFNSCVNPLIYAFFYPWFRKAVRLIVTLRILRPDSREAIVL
ncbi:trace amine-associated receptor 13c-like [Corythoichthys intestinalis]|uniref:trace amine-associated receptor 13c-like n=1 Tax=Corythoichthys intestinalis TaxID=161448 RepID=UPI0025A5E755|nr:trace amine-associated receptor 13c-like [Corythoichthys intestinalis]XP_061799609.1 trace amine-associated receptor 13c-like [Nerophis lumbriciformis]